MSSYPPPPSPPGTGVSALSDQHGLPSTSAQHPGTASNLQYSSVLSSPVAQTSPNSSYNATALHPLQAAAAMSVPMPGSSPVTAQFGTISSPEQSYLGPQNGIPADAGQSAQKVTRLRRACDMCSARKIKCDESGPPCRPCEDLKVECTYNRQMKRRGPPNKYAEAARLAKQARIEPSLTLSPSPQNAAETLVSIAANESNSMTAETIAPWPILELLVDDFFTYIHPLTPFPHEPTFRQSFTNREDRTNPGFLALLASMIGALVASFPRTARLHLKTQNATLFPRAIILIERCREVAIRSRGALFATKTNMTAQDAATSYFIGLAAGYTMEWILCRRFFSETLILVREMGLERTRTGLTGVEPGYDGQPTNHIESEMGKRIFWVMLLGVRSMSQIGATQGELVLPPETPMEPYPEFPAEVDDEYIKPDMIMQQPVGTVSLVTGMLQAVKIYQTMNPLIREELAYGVSNLSWSEQRNLFRRCLSAVQNVLEDIPLELSINLSKIPGDADRMSRTIAESFNQDTGFKYYPPSPYPGAPPAADDVRNILNRESVRRHLQQEIQKANIYASQLATRSHFVERYLNLRDAQLEHARSQLAKTNSHTGGHGLGGGNISHNGAGSMEDAGVAPDSRATEAFAAAAVLAAAEQPDGVDEQFTNERELIVQNLLEVIASIPQHHMEPNGASLINKIRQVASTLVNDAPERKGPFAIKHEQHLHRFVDILMRLEKVGSGAVMPPLQGALGSADGDGVHTLADGGDEVGAMTPRDEDEELRSWADLREYQMRFAASGDFLG